MALFKRRSGKTKSRKWRDGITATLLVAFIAGLGTGTAPYVMEATVDHASSLVNKAGDDGCCGGDSSGTKGDFRPIKRIR
jgi:hypothetical protein